MNYTPRTDALLNNKEVVVDCAFLDFARQLERELVAKNTEKYCFSSCAFFALREELAAQRIMSLESTN